MFHTHFKRRAPIVGCVCVCRTADNVIDNNSSVCLVNQIIIENPSKAAQQQQQQKQQQWKKQQSSRNNNNNNNKNEHGRAPKCVFILVFPTAPSLLFLNARALFFIFLPIFIYFFFFVFDLFRFYFVWWNSPLIAISVFVIGCTN